VDGESRLHSELERVMEERYGEEWVSNWCLSLFPSKHLAPTIETLENKLENLNFWKFPTYFLNVLNTPPEAKALGEILRIYSRIIIPLFSLNSSYINNNNNNNNNNRYIKYLDDIINFVFGNAFTNRYRRGGERSRCEADFFNSCNNLVSRFVLNLLKLILFGFRLFCLILFYFIRLFLLIYFIFFLIYYFIFFYYLFYFILIIILFYFYFFLFYFYYYLIMK
jgi:hypothetical protein